MKLSLFSQALNTYHYQLRNMIVEILNSVLRYAKYKADILYHANEST